MSLLKIPSFNHVSKEDAIVMMLKSISLKEGALAHILNAEAEKIQYLLGSLEGSGLNNTSSTDLIRISKSIECTIKEVINSQLLMQQKLMDLIELTNS